ncbi:hypothetical protein AB0M47_08245 [Hamadaea sp. NPDC051192]|uniref:hypothetical protein n=1 Tax=Hamadaea sp. NPDC051192 TaxID=3154940 RepID=UPI00343AEAEA
MRGPALSISRRAMWWLALTALAVAVLLTVPAFGKPALAAPSGDRISRAEVVSRLEDWVYRDVWYSQVNKSVTDVDDTNHKYRPDCSGTVQMAWHMDPDLSVWTGNLESYTNDIAWADLKAGDILLNVGAGHVVIFHRWENDAHTRMKIFEAQDYGIQVLTRVVDKSEFSAFDARRYPKIFDGVAGTEIASPDTTGCNYDYVEVVHLTGRKNVSLATYSCSYYNSDEDSVGGMLVVKWWPYTGGDDDSDVIDTAKFDGFYVHPQLQLNDITKKEGSCNFENNIDENASGTRGCLITIAGPTSGTWTLDGWFNYDENSDGMGYQGPRYITGSPEKHL